MQKMLVLAAVCGALWGCSSDDEGGGGLGEGDTSGDDDSANTGGTEPGDTDGGTATGGSDPGTGSDDAGSGGSVDVSEPSSSTCADTDTWDPAWAQLEQDVLDEVNVRRSQGANCGGENFGPAEPLVMDPALQCAARLHSKDMAERNFFDHDNPSGEDPWVRIEAAGFTGFAGGENIAAGNSSGEGTVEQWMNSSGHCSNIMNPNFQLIGVGYYPGGNFGHLWTQTFGSSSR